MTGAELRTARKTMGLNQTEFGKLVGAIRHSIAHWERKQGKLTCISTVRDILDVLGYDKAAISRQETHERLKRLFG